jgi:hypothetical protein
MNAATRTPWGPAQGAKELAPGIMSYFTASHGGIRLSPERQRQLREHYKGSNFLGNFEWWEEDCDWAIPYVFFAKEIEKQGVAYKFTENLTAAMNTVRQCHPAFVMP